MIMYLSCRGSNSLITLDSGNKTTATFVHEILGSRPETDILYIPVYGMSYRRIGGYIDSDYVEDIEKLIEERGVI